MLGRFEKLLDSAGKLTVMDALVAAGLVYTVMLIGKQGVKAYQAWSSSSTLTAADIDLLTKELATVLGKYHKAQYEISHQALGSALEEINQALADCERAVRRKPVLVSDNVCDNKDTYAKSLEKRAEIYYWQGHYKAAEEDLLKAFRLGHAKVTTLNLLAHLYMNH